MGVWRSRPASRLHWPDGRFLLEETREAFVHLGFFLFVFSFSSPLSNSVGFAEK